MKAKQKSVFDSTDIVEDILVQRLQIPQTKIFETLLRICSNIDQERTKDCSQYAKFLDESQQIVFGYIGLAITTPDAFDQCRFDVDTNLFQSYAYDSQVRTFLQVISLYSKEAVTREIYLQLLETKPNLYEIIKNAIIMESFNKVTIFSSVWDEILSIVISLLQVGKFKDQMLTEMKTANKIEFGIELEQRVLFGYLISFTMIPNPKDPRMKEFTEKAVMKVKQCKTQNQYDKTCDVS